MGLWDIQGAGSGGTNHGSETPKERTARLGLQTEPVAPVSDLMRADDAKKPASNWKPFGGFVHRGKRPE